MKFYGKVTLNDVEDFEQDSRDTLEELDDIIAAIEENRDAVDDAIKNLSSQEAVELKKLRRKIGLAHTTGHQFKKLIGEYEKALSEHLRSLL